MSQPMQANRPKPQATKPVCNRIAIVFDFDDTLAPDMFDELLHSLGLDSDRFRQQRVQPLLDQGWDKVPARFYTLIQESQQRGAGQQKITKGYLIEFGEQLQPFPGVTDMFDCLRARVQDINPEVELEFYLITGGFAEIARSTCIAPYFEQIWGCEFHYSDSGEIAFLKRSISHTEKTSYLLRVVSGQDSINTDGRAFAYRDVPQESLHVPLSQIIYVGDGSSDIPCFSLINDGGGIAIGVYKTETAEEWTQEVEVSQSQRVVNLAPADYRQDSEMMRSLLLAIESLCKQISLHQLSAGE